MKSAEELKQLFLQERIDYWKSQPWKSQPQNRIRQKIIDELELIQVIVGKPI